MVTDTNKPEGKNSISGQVFRDVAAYSPGKAIPYAIFFTITPANEHVRRSLPVLITSRRTCRSQGRIGEVLTAVVVDHNADGQVSRGDDCLTDVERAVIEFGLSHFANNVEKSWRATVGD